MLEITKMLTLSTAHISQDTAAKLEQESDTNAMGLTVYEKSGSGASYGWFLYISPEHTAGYSKQAVQAGTLPSDLASCMALAHDMGCTVLCLDCEGPIVPYLEKFDW